MLSTNKAILKIKKIILKYTVISILGADGAITYDKLFSTIVNTITIGHYLWHYSTINRSIRQLLSCKNEKTISYYTAHELDDKLLYCQISLIILWISTVNLLYQFLLVICQKLYWEEYLIINLDITIKFAEIKSYIICRIRINDNLFTRSFSKNTTQLTLFAESKFI